VLARHEQAPDAAAPHAAERHWADWFITPGHPDQLRTDSEQNQATVIGRPDLAINARSVPAAAEERALEQEPAA
jgi:hypothetical protein